MQIDVLKKYKLRKGAKPVNHAHCGTNNLEILMIDTADDTVLVKPEGFSSIATFWALASDLEDDD